MLALPPSNAPGLPFQGWRSVTILNLDAMAAAAPIDAVLVQHLLFRGEDSNIA